MNLGTGQFVKLSSLLRKAIPAMSVSVLASVFAMSAQATTLILNGDFELTTGAASGELGYNTNVTGWTTSGYNFLFTPGQADSTGTTGQYGNLKLWGPGDGSINGLPATSPTGGNYVAADGAFQVSPLSQTVDGLLPGERYAVGFWWGGAQQYTFNGATTEKWTVTLGSESYSTSVIADANHGFTGWQYQTFTFLATASTETLSFLATGTPNGTPPFSLLDGVTLTETPEPGTWVAVLAGIVILRWKYKARRVSQ